MRLFGCNQKRFCNTSRVGINAIMMGATKGRGSTTRKFNYCNEHSPVPSQCIYEFIRITKPPSPAPIPEWHSLGSGFDNNVVALSTTSNGHIYAGGYFLYSGAEPMTHISQWNGTNWESVDGGIGNTGIVNGSVNSMATSSVGDLYVGGNFITAGNPSIVANRIAKLDNTRKTWAALGAGANNTIYEVVVDSADNVYVAGAFTNIGNQSISYLAKWVSSLATWTSIGTVNGVVVTMTIDSNDNLYIGGPFSQVNSVLTPGLAKRTANGVWTSIGTNQLQIVQSYCMTVDAANNLYVGGYLQINGKDVYVAKWDGTNWITEGFDVFNSTVNTISIHSDIIYAGGNFTQPANHIAVKKGMTWSSLGTGTNGPVFSSAILPDQGIVIGGTFSIAGDIDASCIAAFRSAN